MLIVSIIFFLVNFQQLIRLFRNWVKCRLINDHNNFGLCWVFLSTFVHHTLRFMLKEQVVPEKKEQWMIKSSTLQTPLIEEVKHLKSRILLIRLFFVKFIFIEILNLLLVLLGIPFSLSWIFNHWTKKHHLH